HHRRHLQRARRVRAAAVGRRHLLPGPRRRQPPEVQPPPDRRDQPLQRRAGVPAMRRAIALLALAGCGSYQSSYHRSRSTPSELVWAYHDRFQVTRDGQIVAEQRDWDALSGVVACVPRARSWAESAASGDRTGSVLSWSGIAVMLGGLVAGSVLI